MYVDGSLQEEGSIKTGTITVNTAAIGVSKRTDYRYWFHGSVDEFVVFNQALDDNEILVLFLNGLYEIPIIVKGEASH